MSGHIPGTSPASGADDRALTRELLAKYDRPGPRYTSYPTAVEFATASTTRPTGGTSRAPPTSDEPLSLYVHLPFCEARCTFCGCSVIITKKREVAVRYLGYLQREIAMLAAALGRRRRLVQYHWGGGTPTYLTPVEMRELHGQIARHFDIDASAEVGIEIDPRVTTPEQHRRGCANWASTGSRWGCRTSRPRCSRRSTASSPRRTPAGSSSRRGRRASARSTST